MSKLKINSDNFLHSLQSYIGWTFSVLFSFYALYIAVHIHTPSLLLKLGIVSFFLAAAAWFNPIIQKRIENFLYAKFGKRPTLIAGYGVLGLSCTWGLSCLKLNDHSFNNCLVALASIVFLIISIYRIYQLSKTPKTPTL